MTEPLVTDFLPQDLSQPFDLAQRFDLVQTLEVAEHLPETSARDFVASIARHGDIVLFSAAVPGQGASTISTNSRSNTGTSCLGMPATHVSTRCARICATTRT
ncbi:hypothetical protein [Qipengyuania sp. 902]|uniref:hypothetical protein n=1 Tax=Qipengyuania sp. 902 TaxID=3417565 RepID=UPI003EC0EEE4